MRVAFGEFVFDADRRELTRHDAPVRLSPKAFDLLALLLRHAPRALRKEELYDSLWPDTFVEYANLHNLISEIRLALADDARTTIQTHRGFGFAFSAERTLLESQTDAPHTSYICRIVFGGRAIDLQPGRNLIGRDADCAIVLDTPLASRHHAAIDARPEGAELHDLGSKNGTSLQGKRIASAMLHDGDRIEIGRVLLRVRILERKSTTVTDAL